MGRVEKALVQYGQPSSHPGLPWDWIDAQLTGAGTYWTSIAGEGTPHPRPVWGVWLDEVLSLSIGSPRLVSSAKPGASIAVHLDSGTDVVIVEGVVEGPSVDASVVAAYDAKYTWTYDVAEYGPLTAVHPTSVLAWQSAGWAGRDGFTATARWTWPR